MKFYRLTRCLVIWLFFIGGHGGEVKCVDWHPKKSLLVTGSRDNQQPVKLWDPRTADPIGTLLVPEDHSFLLPVLILFSTL